MGSFHRRRAFDPLELEIVDRIYEAAWAQIEAENANRDNQRVLDAASQVPQLRSGRSPA